MEKNNGKTNAKEGRSKARRSTSALELAQLRKAYQQNKYRIPPDFNQSLRHRMATRVSKPKIDPTTGEKTPLDPSTGLPIENEQFELFCDPMEFSTVGPAYPMYFHFLKHSIYILLILFVHSGLYNLSVNWFVGSYCQDDASHKSKNAPTCVPSVATRSSLANSLDTERSGRVQDWFNLVGFLALIMYFQYFRYTQKIIETECDQRNWTAANFTFLVTNIPKLPDKNIDLQLKEYFEKNGLPNGQKLNVRRVLLAFDVKDIYHKEEEIQKKLKKVKALENKQSEAKQLETLKTEIEQLEEEMFKICQKHSRGEGGDFVGSAYITVATQKEANRVVEYWKTPSILQRVLTKRTKHELFHGAKLKVTAAPEPSDVYWENLSVPPKEKLARRGVTLTATIMILTVVYFFILGLDLYKLKKEDNLNTTSLIGSLKDHAKIYAVAASVQVFNSLLSAALTFFAKQEKYNTWTKRQISQTKKLAWSQFIVTAVIQLSIAIATSNYYGEDGLIISEFKIFETNAIIPAVVLILNPPALIGWFQMEIEMKKGSKSKLTQLEADQKCEYPQFDLSTRYTLILKNLYAAAFYAPVLPVALVFTLIGNTIYYWADKYTFVRRSSADKALGAEFAQEMTESLEWVLVLYGISNLIFSVIFYGSISWQAVVVFLLAIAHAVSPMAKFNKRIFGEVKEVESNDTFDQKRLEFEEDYDRSNPATHDYSLAKFEAESKGMKFDAAVPRGVSAVTYLSKKTE